MSKQPPTIFAVVLAAGRSSRFGQSKQRIEIGGVPLVRRAVRTAATVCGDRVMTVVGHDAASVLRAINANSGFLVVNDDYDAGIGGSIAVAARACRPCASALLLMLADQPLVTAQHLRALIKAWTGSEKGIVATAFDDAQGPPVLLPRGTFHDLCRLTGDKGARALFRDARFSLKSVRFEPAAVDIDTPDDLAALTQELLHFGDDG